MSSDKSRQCDTCGGSGAADSGGVTPWGAGIDIPCPDCSKPRTVRVRVAVAVDKNGCWSANGASAFGDDDAMGFSVEHLETGEARYFLTAELPIPEVPEVAASVERVESEVGK